MTVWLLGPMLGCAQREATVSGRVTMEGQAVECGTVLFHPQDGGAVCYGTIGPGGSYSVKTGQGTGVAVGEYVVTVQVVSKADTGGGQRGSDGPMGEYAFRLLSPARYASRDESPLRGQVKPGSNRIDLALTAD